MSTTSSSGSDDGIRDGLAKLASPFPESPATEEVRDHKVEPLTGWARARKTAKWLLLGITGLGCMGVFLVAGIFLSNPTIRQIAGNIFWHPSNILKAGGPDFTGYYNLKDRFPVDKQKTLTVLILGVDHDTVGKRDPGHTAVPVEVANAPGRSDAIMIARFAFDGDSISSLNILSIPRDTRVRIPGHGVHKINAAHAYGGPELACATIRDVFKIDPDYFVDLNFEGFQQVVDAVGGVDLTVHQQLDYDDNWGKLHIHLKPGPQHLNGYRAMGYVRFRHTDNDLARAQRQHEFIEALRSRITSPSTFLCLPNAVGAVTSNLHSNLTLDQMLTLANLARKAPKDAICLETLPVIEGRTWVYIDKRKSVGVIRKMFFKDKQEAMLDISTPETDAVPAHRRRRRVHEPAATREASPHAVSSEAPAAVEPSPDRKSDSGDAAGSPSSAPQRETIGTPDKPDRQPAPAPTKPDTGSGSEGGKSPSGEGTGTTSGATNTILRG